jgi:subtilase family serine protease
VIVRLNGTKVAEENFQNLPQNTVGDIKFNWTATQGEHSIKFRIDPQNTSGDIDPSPESNRLIKNFRVGPSTANMVIMSSTPAQDLEMTIYSLPKSPQVGDTVGVTGHVKNLGNADSKVCNLRFKSGTHYYPEIYPVPPIKPGRHFEITIDKKLTRYRAYTMGAELWDCFEQNQNNNKASLDIIPRAPDLIITNVERSPVKVALGQPVMITVTVKNIGTADSGPFNIDAFFEPCTGIAQGPRFASVDNLKPQEEVSKDIKHTFHCIGFKTLKELWVDKGNKVFEIIESNNVYQSFPAWKVGEFVD